MTSLAAQLDGLQHHVLTGDRQASALFQGTRTASRSARLEVYREAYYLRFAEALAANYPALQRLLGEPQFAVLVRGYVDAHPSRHYSVRWFGHRLAAWLRRTAPYACQPGLADLARWEWRLAHAFDAADAVALDRAALAGRPAVRWPAMRFGFHESLDSIATAWNVVDLWRALSQQDEEPPSIARAARAQHWVLWRKDLEVLFQPLPAMERAPLRVARRGGSLADLCALAPDPLDDAAAAQWAAQLLAGWLDRGWIVELRE
jgi:hypothetical protein